MFDFDPRDSDSRDDERAGSNSSRGSRDGSDDRNRVDNSNRRTSERLIVTTLGHSVVVRATTAKLALR